jgi:prepilin-type N-terminal cleavage/methylation domain-containing protein
LKVQGAWNVLRHGRPCAARARRGLTLLEIAVAVAVLAIGLGSSVYALLGGMALQRSAAERTLALQAAESAIEALQAAEFEEAFARFNGTTGDDPGTGLSPGDSFAVPGLTAQQGDADGQAGEILFPGDNVALIENVDDPELGMPRDLSLDEPPIIDGVNHATDYRVLPVRVRVRWRGALGDREVVIGTILNNERKEALP